MIRTSDILCVYDFDTIVYESGILYLRDFGPNACHLPLIGAGAPNPPTRQNDGSYLFDGGNDYLQMTADGAARFWAALVDGHTDFTFITRVQYVSLQNADPLFFTVNGAGTANFVLRTANAGAERLEVLMFTAAGVCLCSDAANVPLSGRTRTTLFSVRYSAGAPNGIYRLHDGGLTVAGSTALTGVPLAFDRTVIPTVGRNAAGTRFIGARIYYLAVLKAIPTPDEAIEIVSLLGDNRKPWVA